MGISVDTVALRSIFDESVVFSSVITNISARLEANVSKLSNPQSMEGLRGGQGDLIVQAFAASKLVLQTLFDETKRLRTYVDSKVVQAVQISQDTNGIQERIDQQRALVEQARLKRS